MQMDVATRACVKRTPSAASPSSRGVRTILLPAAPIESHRVSSMTRTTTFIGRAAFCEAPPVWDNERKTAAVSASAINRIPIGRELYATPACGFRFQARRSPYWAL